MTKIHSRYVLIGDEFPIEPGKVKLGDIFVKPGSTELFICTSASPVLFHRAIIDMTAEPSLRVLLKFWWAKLWSIVRRSK